ncbi:helix-turn-helix domain-containing protein [Anaerococcus rubeinfantis]|uniref:helix-turn-helix domain-containing protein n=1 Tax=Anaerococcus rubeinfantis TaxID=1720199 RepID=UPI00073F03DC|nr:helix-turn-helix domain-containing protein [Anaerococcus rubeinfantis]
MAKYKTEFKIKVVREYLEGNIGYKGLAKKYSIPDHSTVRTWVNAYESRGYEGLKLSRKSNSYSLDLKLNVVDLYLSGEMSYQSLANEFKINNPSMIARWVKEFREEGIEGLKAKKKGIPSIINNTDKNKDIKNKSNKTKKEIIIEKQRKIN